MFLLGYLRPVDVIALGRGDSMAEYEEERQRARELYVQSAGEMSLCEIARQVGRPAGTVRVWKYSEGWERALHDEPVSQSPAVRHGLYGVPKRVRRIMEEARGLDDKALLREVILYQYAAIVRAQEILYAGDGDDTGTLAGGACGARDGTENDPRVAWERHAAFMLAQSRAVTALCTSLRVCRQLEQQADANGQPPDIHIHTHIPRPDSMEISAKRTSFTRDEITPGERNEPAGIGEPAAPVSARAGADGCPGIIGGPGGGDYVPARQAYG